MGLTAEMLGQRVRDAIGAAGLTQQAVAEAAEMDATALSKALAGKRGFSALEFALICDVLHVSPLALLDDGSAPPDPAAENSARVRWMAELDRILTDSGYPPNREHRYPATLLDRAVEAWLAGHLSIRPVAGLIGADPDRLLAEIGPIRPEPSTAHRL